MSVVDQENKSPRDLEVARINTEAAVIDVLAELADRLGTGPWQTGDPPQQDLLVETYGGAFTGAEWIDEIKEHLLYGATPDCEIKRWAVINKGQD